MTDLIKFECNYRVSDAMENKGNEYFLLINHYEFYRCNEYHNIFRCVPDSFIKDMLIERSIDKEQNEHYAKNERIQIIIQRAVHYNLTDEEGIKSHRWAIPQVAKSDNSKIAYYKSREHALKGRKTVTTIGRFLTRFLKFDNDTEVCRDLIKELRLIMTEDLTSFIKFAHTTDEIIDLYTNKCRGGSLSTCMSHDAGYYFGHCHPLTVYGQSKDISIAYLEVDGKVKARAVINNKRKEYNGTQYGDTSMLKQALDDMGYSEGDLTDCIIPKIENENGHGGYIMPYIDFIGTVNDYDINNWIIASYGDHDSNESFNGDQATGLILADVNNRGADCDNCGDRYDNEMEGAYIDDEGIDVCQHCLENDFTHAYGANQWQDYFRTESYTFVEFDCEYYIIDYLANHNLVFCDRDDCAYSLDDCVYLDNYNEYVHLDDVISYDDEYYLIDDCEQVRGVWIPSNRVDDLIDAA